MKYSNFFVSVWAMVLLTTQSFAVEPAINMNDDEFDFQVVGDVPSNPGGSSGAGSSPGSASSSGTSSSPGSGAIQLACLGSDNQIKNGSSSDTCMSILPKCSDLYKSTIDEMKDMLNRKILGYRNGMDVDLNASTSGNLVGKKIAYVPCSVVPYPLVAGRGNAEITHQTSGPMLPCGKRPRIEASKKKTRFKLVYDNDNGSLWISWMLGTYPWKIRKHAVLVKNELKPDLSNLDQVLASSKAMSSDLSKISKEMRDYTRRLSTEAKSSCNAQNSDIIAKCTSGNMPLSDPAQKLCTLVKSQLAAQTGMKYMLAGEVMARVQKDYDSTVAKLMTFQHPSMQSLKDACSDTGSFLSLQGKRRKISKTASCFFGGEFCTSDSLEVKEPPGDKCETMDRRVEMATGRVRKQSAGTNEVGAAVILGAGMGVITAIQNDIQESGSGGEVTNEAGFASVLEYMIRRDCGQSKKTDPSFCNEPGLEGK